MGGSRGSSGHRDTPVPGGGVCPLGHSSLRGHTLSWGPNLSPKSLLTMRTHHLSSRTSVSLSGLSHRPLQDPAGQSEAAQHAVRSYCHPHLPTASHGGPVFQYKARSLSHSPDIITEAVKLKKPHFSRRVRRETVKHSDPRPDFISPVPSIIHYSGNGLKLNTCTVQYTSV